MSRTCRHTLKCRSCPAFVTVEVSQAQWPVEPDRGVAGVARFFGWSVEETVSCPQHKEKT